MQLKLSVQAGKLYAFLSCSDDRVAITAFTPEGRHALSEADCRFLRSLRFQTGGKHVCSGPAHTCPASRCMVCRSGNCTHHQARQQHSRGFAQCWARIPSQGLASRMAAARPVTWGDLLQIPGLSPPAGTWLVLDLWAGFSGLCIAFALIGGAFLWFGCSPQL